MGVARETVRLGLAARGHGRIRVRQPLRAAVVVAAGEERAAIERQVKDRPLEEALANATAALSGLSACAGVVVAPKIERRLRQLAFVPLNAAQALAVVVGEDGSVENRMVTLPPGLTAAALSEIAAYVTARLAGLTLGEAEARLRQEIRERREALDAASQGATSR